MDRGDERGDSGSADSPRVTRATLASQLEDAVRRDILAGVLEPGQRLRAADLTRRYGVSATPLREALQRLAAQNLVEIDPRMGATVVVLSRSDLHDIYWLRELLESRALVRSIARADDAWEARVRRTWEALRHVAADADRDGPDPDAWSRCHRAFHEALFSACDSPWLLRFVNTLYDHSERYRLASVRSRTRDTTEEHLGIYDPAIARDGEGAAAALRAHLKSTVALVDEGLAPDNGLHARQDEEEG